MSYDNLIDMQNEANKIKIRSELITSIIGNMFDDEISSEKAPVADDIKKEHQFFRTLPKEYVFELANAIAGMRPNVAGLTIRLQNH